MFIGLIRYFIVFAFTHIGKKVFNGSYTNNMNTTIQAEHDALKKIIINTVPVKYVYLFGSYAPGTPHKDSDLYVVLSDKFTVIIHKCGLLTRLKETTLYRRLREYQRITNKC